MNKLWPKQGNEFKSNRWSKSGKIHKNPGSMRFCLDKHYVWCSKNVSDDKIYKWSLKEGNRDKPNPYIYQPINTVDGVRIQMDRLLRTKEQKEKGHEWAVKNSHAENSRQFYKIDRLWMEPHHQKDSRVGLSLRRFHTHLTKRLVKG